MKRELFRLDTGLTDEFTPVSDLLAHVRGERLGAHRIDFEADRGETLPHLRNIETLVIDALRFRPHTTHFNIDQALEVAARLGASRTYLTHLSHDVDARRHGASLPEGIELACDGLALPFTLDVP